MSEIAKIIEKAVKEKKELANCKYIMSSEKPITNTERARHEQGYYLGYRQACKDILASFSGEKYNLTEYENANLLYDDIPQDK